MALSDDQLLIINDIIETVAIAFTAVVGFYKYKKLTVSARALTWAVIFICVFDYITDWAKDKNSNFLIPLYTSYFLNLVLMSVFFNYCIPFFQRIRMGVILSITVFLFWCINVLIFKYSDTSIAGIPREVMWNEQKRYMYFQTFYTLCSISLALVALVILFQKNTWAEIRKNLNFWLLVVNMVTDGCIFTTFIILPIIKTKDMLDHKYMYNFISSIVDFIPNDIGMFMFGVIFLIFTRKEQSTLGTFSK